MNWDLSKREHWEKARAVGRLRFVGWEFTKVVLMIGVTLWFTHRQFQTNELFWVVVVASAIGIPSLAYVLNMLYTNGERVHEGDGAS